MIYDFDGLLERAEKAESIASEYCEMLDKREKDMSEVVSVLKELYKLSRSAAVSGEKMWCECKSCNELKKRIEFILEYWG
jgi:hypothetical protein